MGLTKKVSLLFFFSLLFSCSSTRHVLPLEPGHSRVTASLGGPTTQLGSIYTPLPMLLIGYNYGLKHGFDIEGGLVVTSLVFGVTQLDAGLNWHPIRCNGVQPGLYLSLKGNLTTRFEEGSTRVFPIFDGGLNWQLKKKHNLYLGMENWIEYKTLRYDNNAQENHILMNPYIGYIFSHNSWLFQLEVRAITVNLSNESRAAKNIGFGDQGILGAYIGVSREFGGSK